MIEPMAFYAMDQGRDGNGRVSTAQSAGFGHQEVDFIPDFKYGHRIHEVGLGPLSLPPASLNQPGDEQFTPIHQIAHLPIPQFVWPTGAIAETLPIATAYEIWNSLCRKLQPAERIM